MTWSRGDMDTHACPPPQDQGGFHPSGILYNLISATTHSPSVNHVIVPTEESPEEEGLELEEVLEGAPEDDGDDPDEEEHGLGYPMQHH
ncbi:hypothetical protein DUI87_00881 [Hirundo rustica rustica]|uniref:Uncharacterized protein n=1 Tax=Hirundo rustica rustica TaxID=333673 RepID=A0A3M0L3Q5_HIRRU|nr:hypothetical protein DUI87_00881 [Hirundo rustica rustica]